MNIIAKHNDLPIAVIGDIHGEFNVIIKKVKHYDLNDVVLLVAGDMGVGFNYNNPREPKKEKVRLLYLNQFLKRHNIFLYIVRGNHDNPSFYDGKHNLSNLIFMQDYDIVQVGEYMILGVGGATSVDRKPNHHFKDYKGENHPGRRENVDWWPNEKVIYDEEKLNVIAGIDIVVTHTCPDFVHPPVLGDNVWKWCDCDPELKSELIEERELMGKIYDKLNELSVIKWWYYAHYHQSNFQTYNSTKFKLLDIGEFHEIKFKNEQNE